MANHAQSGKERAADEQENNAKHASGVWVRFVGCRLLEPGSGSFGKKPNSPAIAPEMGLFFRIPNSARRDD
jgi:hypothetical protein